MLTLFYNMTASRKRLFLFRWICKPKNLTSFGVGLNTIEHRGHHVDPSGDLRKRWAEAGVPSPALSCSICVRAQGVAVGPEGVSASSSLATLAGDSRSESSFWFLSSWQNCSLSLFFLSVQQVPGHHLTPERTLAIITAKNWLILPECSSHLKHYSKCFACIIGLAKNFRLGFPIGVMGKIWMNFLASPITHLIFITIGEITLYLDKETYPKAIFTQDLPQRISNQNPNVLSDSLLFLLNGVILRESIMHLENLASCVCKSTYTHIHINMWHL